MQMLRPQRIFLIIGVSVLAGVLLVWQLRSVGTFLDPYDDQPFSVAAWSAADETERAPMVRSVMKNYVRVDMTEDEVIGLLGEAWIHETEHIGMIPPAGGRTYAYGIGHQTYDDTFLYVHFDAAGKVVGTEIGGY